MGMKLVQDNTSTRWQNQDSKPGSVFQESMHLTSVFAVFHKNVTEVQSDMEDERAINFVGSRGQVSEKHIKFEFGIEEGVEEIYSTLVSVFSH